MSKQNHPAAKSQPAPKVTGIPARPLFTTTVVEETAAPPVPVMSEKTKAEMAAGVAALSAYRPAEEPKAE